MAFLGFGAALFGAGTFLAATADLAIGLAASVGISYAAQELAGKPKPPEAAHFSAQGQMQYGGAVPRAFPLGKTCTGGSLAYHNHWGNSGGTPNAYYTQVASLSDLPGISLLGVWVNGSKCTLGDVAHPDFGLPVLEYRKNGTDHVWVKFYDGRQIAADPLLTTKVASPDRPYATTRVGYGVAYAIGTALVDDTLFTGLPQFKYEVSGIPLYDPTKDSTNGGDGTHRFDDPSTWGGDGDDLPAVQAYNVLRGVRYKGQWVYGLQRATAAMLPTLNWNLQIDKCRALVDGPDGDEIAYQSGGMIAVNSRPSDALTAMMTTCQGKLSEVGGWYKVHLGAPDEPSFSFTDDDILSSEDQTFKPFLSIDDSINGIAATYTDPAQGWSQLPVPPLYNATYEAADGNQRLLATPAFDMVYRPAQAQRLAASALAAARRERAHAIVLPPRFWFIEPGDTGRWTSVRNNYAAKLFEVSACTDRANLDVIANLQEVEPTDYAYNPATQYVPPVYGPTSPNFPPAQPFSGFDAKPASYKDEDGLSRRPAIEAFWDGTQPGVNGVSFDVTLTSDGSYVTSGIFDQLELGRALIRDALLPHTHYTVRMRYVPSAPRDVLWSAPIDVLTPDVRLTTLDFQDYVNNLVTTNVAAALQELSRQLQLVANSGTEQDFANALDRIATRTLISAQGVTIRETAQVVETIDGKVAGMVSLLIDNNGRIVGTIAYNDGTTGSFTVLADQFFVAAPGDDGGEPRPLFLLTEDGAILNVDLVGAGTITAPKLLVDNVRAITGNFGDAEFTGKITGGAAGLLDIDCTNGNIIGYAEE